MKGQNTLFSHSSDSWETPKDLFDKLDAKYHFTLDPCATEENAKCEHFFTQEENGLNQDWSGNVVFVNPPFSEISKWVEKSWLEFTIHGVTVVMLLPSRTDTKWFHKYIYETSGVTTEFIRGRLKFGNSKNSAPFPSMIVCFSPNNKRLVIDY